MRSLQGTSWICYSCGRLATETGAVASIAQRLDVARATAVGMGDHLRDALVETVLDVEDVLEGPLDRAFERMFGKKNAR